MAELGWAGMLVSDAHGGSGLGLADAAIVAEGVGRALMPEPFTASAVLAAQHSAGAQNEALKQSVLPALVRGELVPALAWQERPAALDSAHIAAAAVPFEGGYRLNGTKRYVSGAAGADVFIVAARNEGGLVLACVDRNAPGVQIDLELLADGRHFGTVELRDAVVPRERVAATGEAATAALEAALDHAAAIAGAELYGVMSRALEMSTEYMKTRVQFGRPIEASRDCSIVRSTYTSSSSPPRCWTRDCTDARRHRTYARRRRVESKPGARSGAAHHAREAIQIHGAIGFTDEYDAGLY